MSATESPAETLSFVTIEVASPSRLGYTPEGRPLTVEAEAKLLPATAGVWAIMAEGFGLVSCLDPAGLDLAGLAVGDLVANPVVDAYGARGVEAFEILSLDVKQYGGLVVKEAVDQLTVRQEHEDRQRRSRADTRERERRAGEEARRVMDEWDARPLEDRRQERLERLCDFLAGMPPERFSRFMKAVELLGREGF